LPVAELIIVREFGESMGWVSLEMDERSQRLKHARAYCLERLVEVKGEIARLHEEGRVLKASIDTVSDEAAEGHIRRRRRFLNRRVEELKAERLALTQELEIANAQLSATVADISGDGHTHVSAESASSGLEQHEGTEFSE
jgi:predicted  nucleic acid-binding Zn-ribbon protein